MNYNNDKTKIIVKYILPVTVAFDHRALDFGDIVPFIRTLSERLDTY